MRKKFEGNFSKEELRKIKKIHRTAKKKKRDKVLEDGIRVVDGYVYVTDTYRAMRIPVENIPNGEYILDGNCIVATGKNVLPKIENVFNMEKKHIVYDDIMLSEAAYYSNDMFNIEFLNDIGKWDDTVTVAIKLEASRPPILIKKDTITWTIMPLRIEGKTAKTMDSVAEIF